MQTPVAESQTTFLVGHDRPRMADAQRANQRARLGRAYRAGRLICGWVQVTVTLDDRLGLTRRERRMVRIRFHEPVDDGLRDELTRLMRRRGSAADRLAERIDPIEVVVDDPRGERLRLIGSVQPPEARHGQLRDIEFGLRELERSR